jgi:hypothetical protein
MSKFFAIWLVFVAAACNSSKAPPDNSTDLQCANAFLRSLYEGNFDRAGLLLLQNDDNLKHLQQAKFNFNQGTSEADKKIYKTASVILLSREPVDTQTVIFTYRDPVKKQTMPPLKVVKNANGWYVDFAYSFSGNM